MKESLLHEPQLDEGVQERLVVQKVRVFNSSTRLQLNRAWLVVHVASKYNSIVHVQRTAVDRYGVCASK